MIEEAIGKNIDERIIAFLKQNTALTIAVCANNVPYCANCFYAYDEGNNWLVLKSKKETIHIQQAVKNKNVAGTILPDKSDLTTIKGIQFTGFFIEPVNGLLELQKKIYYAKYPFALVFPGEIWAIELTSIKFTDNTLGFGKRIEWIKQK